MNYRCEAASIQGFVQQVACCYVRDKYCWFVTGVIPKYKNPHKTDQKIISQYNIAVSESTRYRRKKQGKANLQYIRYQHFYAIMATAGEHEFYEREHGIKDLNRLPLYFSGYAISRKRGGRLRSGEADPQYHSHVRIADALYEKIEARFLHLCIRRSLNSVVNMFYGLPFEPYAPVRRQYLQLLNKVNKTRKQARLPPLPKEILPLRRRVVKPFEASVSHLPVSFTNEMTKNIYKQ